MEGPTYVLLTADFLANGVHSATHRTFDEFVVAGKKRPNSNLMDWFLVKHRQL